MTHDEARAAIETLFAAGWVATPVAWPNVEFTPPSDGSAWVRLSIENRGTAQASFGGAVRRFRCRGLVLLEIYIEAGTGTAVAFQHADTVAELFADAGIAGLVFEAAGVMPGREDKRYFALIVTVPYWHDDFR